MLDLESAIKHCEEVAEQKEREAEYRQETHGDMIKFLDDLSKSVGGEGIEDDALNECLECASEHRQLAEWLRELKRDREILNGLSTYFQSLAVNAVINQKPLMFDMRDATEEERESVKQYIVNSISTTGVNFWSIIGEVNADE